MENVDVTVLRTLRDWRIAGRRALLATVVRTWGSSPRPAGSIMALCETGTVIGSVSGGCVEDDLIRRYATAPDAAVPPEQSISTGPQDRPQRLRYGVSADEAHRFGLPCGGTLELVLEFNPDAVALAELVAKLEQGHLVRRVTDLDTGAVTQTSADHPEALHVDACTLVNTFGPEYRMLLIGAGQLSACLATIALLAGFAVTVCDPRREYTGVWGVPGVTLSHDMPDDLVRHLRPNRRCCVIALTHDPKLDDLALLEALDTDAFYVGAIGSRKNQRARMQRLAEHFGLGPERLARLHGPIGLYIGSRTPAEIAVSVMAEVLAVKNNIASDAHRQVGPAKDERCLASHDSGRVICGEA